MFSNKFKYPFFYRIYHRRAKSRHALIIQILFTILDAAREEHVESLVLRVVKLLVVWDMTTLISTSSFLN